jgi:methionine-R-sulfoxide reductase
MNDGRSYPLSKTDEQWREQLSSAEYEVLRQAGTERPGVGEYTDTVAQGVYSCRACGSELFRSDTKFDSHCGWPSFYAPLAEDRVVYIEDHSMGTKRVVRDTTSLRTSDTASTASACDLRRHRSNHCGSVPAFRRMGS